MEKPQVLETVHLVMKHVIPDGLYSPGTLTAMASIESMKKEWNRDGDFDEYIARRFIHMIFRRIAKNFPELGDGLITIEGMNSFPGWRGNRWIEAYKDIDPSFDE